MKGGLHGQPGNPEDPTDEGVFISKITLGSVASREPKLKIGQRIIEVNSHSLLGETHDEAVNILRSAGNSIHMIVCDGFDVEVEERNHVHDQREEEEEMVERRPETPINVIHEETVHEESRSSSVQEKV